MKHINEYLMTPQDPENYILYLADPDYDAIQSNRTAMSILSNCPALTGQDEYFILDRFEIEEVLNVRFPQNWKPISKDSHVWALYDERSIDKIDKIIQKSDMDFLKIDRDDKLKIEKLV